MQAIPVKSQWSRWSIVFVALKRKGGKTVHLITKTHLESPMLQQLHLAQHQLWLHKLP